MPPSLSFVDMLLHAKCAYTPSLHGPCLLSAAAEKGEAPAQLMLETQPSHALSDLELEVPALEEIMSYSFAHVSTLSTHCVHVCMHM